MFDLSSERLLENEERFAARNGHRFVEIWDCGDTRPPIYRSGELKEKEIASWVHEERSANGPIRSGLRVLLCPKPAGKPSSGKLPFSQETFRQLSRAWRMPSTFLRAIAQKLSIVTQCVVAPVPVAELERSAASLPNSPRSPRHRAATFSSLPTSPVKERIEGEEIVDERRSSISDSATCLLVRGDVDWTWDYTMLLIHDPAAHMTYAIVVGLTAIEIDLIQSYLSSPAITCSSLSTHPILLPVLLSDLATDETASLLKIRIKLLSQIQQQTGMDRFNSLRSANVSGRTSIGGREKERHELDLDAVMLRLTCLSDWVAAQRGFVSIQQRVVGVIDEMLCSTPQSAGTSPATDVTTQFTERLSFISQSLCAAEQKCQYLERSISAQVQTIYSLIGQKDNRLNIAAASASCQIASDSRRIAILTRRDSTDMRIIAAVTLIFLPGTFVATIFSTGLFDWGYGPPTPGSDDGGGTDSGGGLISKYLWVYFMLTGVLTFVVLVAWVLFSWFQNRKMMRQFGIDIEQGIGIEGDGLERRESDITVTSERRKVVGRGSWAFREFERWKEDARGSLRWWRTAKKDDIERLEKVEEGKYA